MSRLASPLDYEIANRKAYQNLLKEVPQTFYGFYRPSVSRHDIKGGKHCLYLQNYIEIVEGMFSLVESAFEQACERSCHANNCASKHPFLPMSASTMCGAPLEKLSTASIILQFDKDDKEWLRDAVQEGASINLCDGQVSWLDWFQLVYGLRCRLVYHVTDWPVSGALAPELLKKIRAFLIRKRETDKIHQVSCTGLLNMLDRFENHESVHRSDLHVLVGLWYRKLVLALAVEYLRAASAFQVEAFNNNVKLDFSAESEPTLPLFPRKSSYTKPSNDWSFIVAAVVALLASVAALCAMK